MTTHHITIGKIKAFPCKKTQLVCEKAKCKNKCYNDRSNKLIDEPEEFDNSDVIDSIYNKKQLPADERMADRAVVSGNKNRRAIEGAVRATKDQFKCHFEEELRKNEKSEWWGENDYDVPNIEKNDSKWWEQLSYYRTFK
jgi:hypothetical protein